MVPYRRWCVGAVLEAREVLTPGFEYHPVLAELSIHTVEFTQAMRKNRVARNCVPRRRLLTENFLRCHVCE